MGLQYPGSGTPQLYIASALITAPPLSILLRFRADALNLHHTLFAIGRMATSLEGWHAYLSNTNVLRARTWPGPSDSSGFTISDTNPHSALFVWASATSRRCWLDGTADTENTTSRVPANLDRTTIGGHWAFGTLNDHLSHTIWDFALFNAALGQTEADQFHAGWSTRKIARSNRIAQLDCLVDGRDSHGNSWTESGLTPVAHPTVVSMPRTQGGLILPGGPRLAA